MLYNTTPDTAAPAMTLMGLGFHLRKIKKPTRKIATAIKSILPNSAGKVRCPYRAMHNREIPAEAFNKRGRTVDVYIGEPVSPEEIQNIADDKDLAEFLYQRTYAAKK